MHRNVFPLMYDSAMAVQEVYNILVQDTTISDKAKNQLLQNYPCATEMDEAIFLTSALCFGMERTFVKRDANTKKAYAKQFKKDYTNVLYLTYTGDLKQDIIDMDFSDDLQNDNDEERFRKHYRFLRTLKEDTLLIIDNFNTTAIQDGLLSAIMKYRCRIIFTTRSRFENYTSMNLEEISDTEVHLLEQFGLVPYHDSVQEAMGNICLTMGEVNQATTHFQKAMAVYEMVFEAEPEMIEAKKQALLGTYAQAGLYLGKQMLENNDMGIPK